MNTLKKIVVAAAVAVTAFGAVGTSAYAGDWQGRGYGQGGYGRGGYAPQHYAPAPQYGYRHNSYNQYQSRDRRGERIATGVAIGVGAIILGSILANQSRRSHYNGY